MPWLRTTSQTTASCSLQTSQPFLWVCSWCYSKPRHKFSYKNLQSETRCIPQYTVCFTYIIRHGPCSNSLRRFNYLSGISIFTPQLVWDTRLPLVECGRACPAPAIILTHPQLQWSFTRCLFPAIPPHCFVNLMSGLDPWLILKWLTE